MLAPVKSVQQLVRCPGPIHLGFQSLLRVLLNFYEKLHSKFQEQDPKASTVLGWPQFNYKHTFTQWHFMTQYVQLYPDARHHVYTLGKWPWSP